MERGSGPQQQEVVAMDTAMALTESNEQLRQFQGDIEVLNEISKNIAVMMVDQGRVVDKVEANVNSAADRVHDGTEALKRITSATADLEKAMKGLGTQSDGRDLRDDLISKKDAILAGIKIMKAILLSTRERAEKDKSRTLNVRYDRLTKDFRAVLSKAEATLRVYEGKLKEHRLRDYTHSDTLTSGSMERGSGPQQQEVVAMDTAVALTERNQQLRQLQGDIDEISKNITVMLMDQGGVVENVEANVNSIDDRVDDGTEELKKGSALARKNRYIIAAIVAVVVGVVIVVLLVIILGSAIGCSVNRCAGQR